MAFNITYLVSSSVTGETSVDFQKSTLFTSSSSKIESTPSTTVFSSGTSLSSTEYSIVEPSSLRLDTSSDTLSSVKTLNNSPIESSSSTVPTPIYNSYPQSISDSASAYFTISSFATYSILTTHEEQNTSISVRSADDSSQYVSSTLHSITESSSSVHWNYSSIDFSSQTVQSQTSITPTASSKRSISTLSFSDPTSSSIEPSSSPVSGSSSLQQALTPSTSSTSSTLSTSSTSFSTWASSTSSNEPGFSVSTNLKSIYYIYTQMYEITGSSTTFSTGLPTTTVIDAQLSTSIFSTPKSTMTKDLEFYEKWANGNLATTSLNQSRKNKIIGGVVGGVGGLILCCLVIFFFFWKKRKDSKKVKGFSSEIGRRAGYPFPSSEGDIYEEKTAITDNSAGAVFARIKDRAIPPILKKVAPEQEIPISEGDPFQNEFNFESRVRPPLPPPRKNTASNSHVSPNIPSNPTPIREVETTDNRYSYVSSMSESSAQGDYSTMSSTSIRLGMQGHDNSLSHSSQGFFREVI